MKTLTSLYKLLVTNQLLGEVRCQLRYLNHLLTRLERYGAKYGPDVLTWLKYFVIKPLEEREKRLVEERTEWQDKWSREMGVLYLGHRRISPEEEERLEQERIEKLWNGDN